MPFINFITNVSVPDEKEKLLKTRLGEAITAVPGKSEEWLMVHILPDAALYFRGSDAPAAMVEVTVFGHAEQSAYVSLTSRICEAAKEILDIPPSSVYVRYAETDEWGWNGMNF